MRDYANVLRSLFRRHDYLHSGKYRILNDQEDSITLSLEKYVIKFMSNRDKFENFLGSRKKISIFVKVPDVLKIGKMNGVYYIISKKIDEPIINKIHKKIRSDKFIRLCAELLAEIHKNNMMKISEIEEFQIKTTSSDLERCRLKSKFDKLYDLVFDAFLRVKPSIILGGGKSQKIIDLLVQNRYLFNDNGVCFIHGDFQGRNLIFNKDGLYLIDFEGSRYFDFYYDFCSVYERLFRGNDVKFRKFIKMYSEGRDIEFSNKRFFINSILFHISRNFIDVVRAEGSKKNVFADFIDKLNSLIEKVESCYRIVS